MELIISLNKYIKIFYRYKNYVKIIIRIEFIWTFLEYNYNDVSC